MAKKKMKLLNTQPQGMKSHGLKAHGAKKRKK